MSGPCGATLGREVFGSFERAFDDFLAVVDKIDRVVEGALELKPSRIPAPA